MPTKKEQQVKAATDKEVKKAVTSIASLKKKVSSLEIENTDLKEQLAWATRNANKKQV